MDLSDRIVAADAELLSLKDALVEATKSLEAAPDEEALLIEVEELSAKVEKQTDTVQALKRAEAALAARAEKAVAAPAIVQAKHIKSAPEGLMFKHAAAKFIAFAERKSVDQVFEERYADEVEAVKASYDHIQKTAVLPADTTTTGWAAELVQTDIRGFLDTLKTTSVAAALAGKSQLLSFGGYNSITVPRRNPLSATPTEPAWVGEGGVIPLTQFSFGSTVINRYKLAAITTMTKELTERSTPAIEGILRSALTEAYSVVLDNALLSTGAAVQGIRPAGLRNGLSGGATGTGDATGGSASLSIDLKAMLGYMQANRTGSRPVLLMNNATRLSISMLQSSLSEFLYRDEIAQSRLLGMEVVSSDHVPAGVVMLVDADALATAFDAPMFDVSDVATVTEANADGTAPTQAEDGAGALGTAGQVPEDKGAMVSGSTGAAFAGMKARSLWQTYSVGIRMVAPTSWALLRPNSVVQRTSVTW
jgi:HK97 family phage major capsid protein